MEDGYDLPRKMMEQLAELALASDTQGWYELEAMRDAYFARQAAAAEAAEAAAAAAAAQAGLGGLGAPCAGPGRTVSAPCAMGWPLPPATAAVAAGPGGLYLAGDVSMAGAGEEAADTQQLVDSPAELASLGGSVESLEGRIVALKRALDDDDAADHGAEPIEDWRGKQRRYAPQLEAEGPRIIGGRDTPVGLFRPS